MGSRVAKTFEFTLDNDTQYSDEFPTPPDAVRIGFIAEANDDDGAGLKLQGAVSADGPWVDTTLAVTALNDEAMAGADANDVTTEYALFSRYRIEATSGGDSVVLGAIVSLPA